MAKTVLARAALALALAAGLSTTSPAADLTVGLRADVNIDPHYLFLGPNMAMSRHLFGALVDLDENSKRRPGLALSWRPLDDTTWEFKLRPGVKFHDGSDFSAEDVAFTIKRIPTIPNNPNPYTPNIRSIVATEIVDPLTVRFKTGRPNPALPGQLTNVFMVSRKAAADAAPADFVSGKAAIGTGPFRFVEYARADRLVLARNDAYWGEKPVWEKVTFRFLPNTAARVAALLSGAVELIDYVPPTDIESIEKSGRAKVFKRVSDRVMYLAPMSGADKLALTTDKAGAPLAANPMKDARVRRAISKAINREVLVARAMEGLAVPSTQLIPEGFGSYNARIPLEAFDPDGARRLLVEAGFPNGFGFLIGCTSDRYVNDGQVCQAVGQMLNRAGLAAKVETYPSSIFFARTVAPKSDVPLMLLGLSSSSTGDSIHALSSVLHSYDREKGMGVQNFSVYTNKELDALVERAVVTLDDQSRDRMLQEAMALAMQDLGIIPLYTQMTISAARTGIDYVPRMDEQAVVMHARPAR